MKIQCTILLSFIVAMILTTQHANASSWHKTETENFIIYSERDAEYTETQARFLERFRYLLFTINQVEHQAEAQKIVILSTKNKSTLRVMAQEQNVMGLHKSSIYGTYFVTNTAPLERAPLFVKLQSLNHITGYEALFYQYTQHFIKTYQGKARPIWYIEGTSSFYSSILYSKDQLLLGFVMRARALELSTSRWLPWQDIFYARSMPDNDASLFKAQSWLATHYLTMNPERLKQLKIYIQEIENGIPVNDAFQNAFQQTPEELGNDLRTYYDKKNIQVRTAKYSFKPIKPVTTKLSKDERSHQFAILASRFSFGDTAKDQKFRTDNIKRLRKALDRNGTNVETYFMLARLLIAEEDIDAVDQVISEMTQQFPNHYMTYHMQGKLYYIRNNNIKAREFFDLARNANHNFAPAHYYYAETFYYDDDLVTEEAILAIEQASKITADYVNVPIIHGALLKRIGRIDEGNALLLKHYMLADGEHQERLLFELNR